MCKGKGRETILHDDEQHVFCLRSEDSSSGGFLTLLFGLFHLTRRGKKGGK